MLNVEEICRKDNKKRSMVHTTIVQPSMPVSTKNIPLIEQYPFYELYLQYSKSIQSQFLQLTHYLNELQQKIQNVKEDQINCLSVKHRYYIRKFRKYYEEQQKLLDFFQNLQNIILESPQVQQEIKSINFIQMVSQQTQTKLQHLKQIVQKAQAKKAQNQLNIKILRQKLIECKKTYFQKKRQQAALQNEIESNKKKKCMQHIDRIMKKIRHQKKQKLEEMRKSFNHVIQVQDKFKMSGLSYRGWQKTQINSLKLQTLAPIKQQERKAYSIIKKSTTHPNFGKKSKDYQSIFENEKKKQDQKENEPIYQPCTSNNTSLLTNEQILKNLSNNNNENLTLKQKFRGQSSQSVLKLIIQYGKMSEILAIIDQDKVSSLVQCSQKINDAQNRNNIIGYYV